MKAERTEVGDDMDLVKVYIWLMAALSVGLGGVLWYFSGQVDQTDKLVNTARKKMDAFSDQKEDVLAMLNVFTNNQEEQAREHPMTWFPRRWQRKGISDQSVRPGAWVEKYYPRGNFDEHRIEFKFDNKKPLSRQHIGEFAHAIERDSTRLRIIEMKMRRASGARNEEYKPEDWSGEIVVGYRKARIRE